MDLGRKLIGAVAVLSAVAIGGLAVASLHRDDVRARPTLSPAWICPFSGRTGEIHFINSTLLRETVTLWHPASEAPFKSWTVNAGQSLWLDRGVAYGDDWGFQIDGGRIKCVARIADWVENAFHVTTAGYFARE